MRGSFALLWIVLAVSTPTFVAKEKVPLRVVTITALVDSADVMVASRFLNNALYTAARVFKKEFNIKLELVVFDIGSWRPPSDDFDADKEFVRLTQMPRKSDVVVAFTTKSFFRNEENGDEIDGTPLFVKATINGCARVRGNLVLVQLEEKTDLLLIHELGHIFGARHSTEINSVMSDNGITTPTFDVRSREVIFANRNRPF